jgi:hypothetical protein
LLLLLLLMLLLLLFLLFLLLPAVAMGQQECLLVLSQLLLPTPP